MLSKPYLLTFEPIVFYKSVGIGSGVKELELGIESHLVERVNGPLEVITLDEKF